MSNNYNKLNDSYLKKMGYDAEEFKEGFVGKNGGKYDMYQDKDTKEIVLMDKAQRKKVETGEYLER